METAEEPSENSCPIYSENMDERGDPDCDINVEIDKTSSRNYSELIDSDEPLGNNR